MDEVELELVRDLVERINDIEFYFDALTYDQQVYVKWLLEANEKVEKLING